VIQQRVNRPASDKRAPGNPSRAGVLKIPLENKTLAGRGKLRVEMAQTLAAKTRLTEEL
jgi:hypothetical protein